MEYIHAVFHVVCGKQVNDWRQVASLKLFREQVKEKIKFLLVGCQWMCVKCGSCGFSGDGDGDGSGVCGRGEFSFLFVTRIHTSYVCTCVCVGSAVVYVHYADVSRMFANLTTWHCLTWTLLNELRLCMYWRICRASVRHHVASKSIRMQKRLTNAISPYEVTQRR